MTEIESFRKVWEYAGDRGVFSESPYHFRTAFDVFVLEKNRLYYRLLAKNMRPAVELPPNYKKDGMFDGTVFHDPMECFTNLADAQGTISLTIIDPESDVIETSRSFPYSAYEEYLASKARNEGKTMGQICDCIIEEEKRQEEEEQVQETATKKAKTEEIQ